MNPIEKWLRKIAREEAKAVLASSETKLTLKVLEEDIGKAVAVRELRKSKNELRSSIDDMLAD